MSEKYRFFNYSEGDEVEYQASEFAEYFSRFLSDGVYTESGQLGLKVSSGSGLSINVATGYAYVRGYMYHNDDILNKALDAPDSVLDRIDRIVLRFDEVNRNIKIEVKKGAFSSSPTPPTLINSSTVKELSLAQVRIRKNATSISATDITDERLSEFCGMVSLLVDVPLNDLLAEWQAWKSNNQIDFETWLQGLEEILDENTAGNLLNLINTNISAIANLQTEKMNNDKIIISPDNADVNLMSEGGIWIKYK